MDDRSRAPTVAPSARDELNGDSFRSGSVKQLHATDVLNFGEYVNVLQNLTSKCARSETLSRSILFHARARGVSVSTLFVPALADVRILSAMP